MIFNTRRSLMWQLGLGLIAAQAVGWLLVWLLVLRDASSQDVLRDVLIGIAASLILTLCALGFIAWGVNHSVKQLSEGAERYAEGDLRHRIDTRAGAELSDLAESFNQMAARLGDQIELLTAQQSQQRIIHQSMSTAMVALDADQRVLSINRAGERLLGLDEDVIKGRSLRDVLQEPELNRFVGQVMNADKPASAEFALLSGAAPAVHVVGEPLRNGENESLGLLLLINDITRMKRLEAMRSDFAANVSHELRTPITNIKGYVETLLDVGVGDANQTSKFLGVIQRNTERLASIIEDLLSLSRLEQPDTQSSLERTDTLMIDIVNAATAQFEPACSDKHMSVAIDVPPGLSASVNAQLIEQALANLLSNAIKYSPKDTTVTIRASRPAPDEVEIAVIDQGPGIAREHLPRLFERFYRVDRARSREMGGTGLGLAIVKHIAQVHGGRVDVQSELGKGSTFRIILPSA